MGADRRHYEHIEVRLDDRAAAGEGIRGRAGRARNDDAVAGMRVDIHPIQMCFKVDHPTRHQLLHHHVIERQRFSNPAIGVVQTRRQQRALVRRQSSFQRCIDAGEHVLRHDIGQKPESPTVDTQERYLVPRHQSRRIEQGSVTANGNDQVRGSLRSAPPASADAGRLARISRLGADDHLDLSG